MIHQLEDIFGQAQQLAVVDQVDLADMVHAFITARTCGQYQLSIEEDAAIDGGVEQISRNEFASDKEVDALLNQSWA